jgi:hypothetical protein
MNKAAIHKNEKEHGAVLVITLLVIVVLAVAAVAFMQNTSAERQTARSQGSQYRAQLAAEAGAAAAMGTVADLITRYPDSVTVWQNIGGGPVNGTSNEATVLYFRATAGNSNVGASPAAFGDQVALWTIPLVSRTNTPTTLNTSPVALASIVSSVPLVSGVTTNLNATNAVWTEPFIGRRTTTNPGAPVTAGQWIYLTKFGGPTNATNPYVARFAYWIEDESFKVNVNVATNGLRGTASLGLGPDEIRIDGAWRASTNASLTNANAAAAINDRSSFGPSGYPTVRSAVFPALGNTANITNTAEFRFLTTTHSAGLDLSRGGFKRFDINELVRGGASAYRLNADRFIAAITNTNSAPLFGQRFYRDTNNINATNTVASGPTPTTGNHALIYLNKLAANIIDYIDADSQPTIFDNARVDPNNANSTNYIMRVETNTGGPLVGIEPLGGGWDGTNSTAAIGIENIPRLQEYAVHARITKLDRIGYDTNSLPADLDEELEFSVDYYFEFWNPGIQDVTLPPDTFLKISDQPSFENASGSSAGINGSITNRNAHLYKIVLSNALNLGTGAIYTNGIPFPAGSVTVLTTSPTNMVNTNLLRGNSNNVISIEPSVISTNRLFKSTVSSLTNTALTNIGGTNYNRFFFVRSKGSPGHGDAHYLTTVLLANTNGVLDSIRGLPITDRLTIAATNDTIAQSIGSIENGNLLFVRGGGIRGNVSGLVGGRPKSTEGDARAINEQLEFRLHNTGSADETRYYDSDSRLTNIPTSSTIGFANTNTGATIGVNPSVWTDFSMLSGGAASAPLVVRNTFVDSVAELGHITDPARVPGTLGTLTNAVFSRGGGRTLRIGQPELPSWYDSNQTNASRTWASWRLADIFTTTNAVTIDGLINPNGVLRDRGVALRAALHGFTYLASPNGAPNTAGTTLSSNNITTLVTNIVSRMTNTNSFNPTGSLNPFWERGEISELGVLNTGTALLGTGINMSNTIDRGREELIRRSMQMLTTRGSIFTVYVIGQSIQTTATTTNVASTSRLRQVFQLEPVALSVNNSFNPTNSSDISNRFGKPTGYDVRILSTSYD